MRARRFRDLTLLETRAGKLLIACDSCGGIGSKPSDVVVTDAQILGYYLCRVPLMELLSQGVAPSAAVVTLSCEREPTGRKIYEGVARALREVGLDPRTILNGSTEENIPTLQTGAGITLIGEADEPFAFRSSPSGAGVFVLGIPKVGEQVLEDRGEIVPMSLIPKLLAEKGVYEILPVGSRGCLFEAGELARTCGLQFVPAEKLPEWAERSAGPSCAVLVSAEEEALCALEIPVHRLGALV